MLGVGRDNGKKMNQNQILAILEELRALDDGLGTERFWENIDEIIAQGSELVIELYRQDRGFKIMVNHKDGFGIYESARWYFRERFSFCLVESMGVSKQRKAYELYHRVMSDLLDLAA